MENPEDDRARRNRGAARKVAATPLPPEPLGEPHALTPDVEPHLARTAQLAEFLRATGVEPTPHALTPDFEPYLARTVRLAEFLRMAGVEPTVDYNVVEVVFPSKVSWGGFIPWTLRIRTACPVFGQTRDQVTISSAPSLVLALHITADHANPNGTNSRPITPADMETWRTEFEILRQLGEIGMQAATWLGMEPIPDWSRS